MSSEKNRPKDLHKLRSFLERQLRKLRSPGSKTNKTQTCTVQEEVKVNIPNPTVKLETKSESKAVVTNEEKTSENAEKQTEVTVSEFEKNKKDLVDRCERKITELKCLCRNIVECADNKEYPKRPPPTESELKRQALIRKLIAAETQERSVLLEIGKRGRELHHLLINDNKNKDQTSISKEQTTTA